jgi:flagellar biosynthesis/type III secretory pathway protein FliH
MPFIDLPPDALDGTEDFVGVILRKTDAGICLVAVTKPDARSEFERLAAAKFAELEEARAAREAAAEQEERLREAHERGVTEGAERLAAKMGMSVEEMRQHLKGIQTKVQSSTVDKAVG